RPRWRSDEPESQTGYPAAGQVSKQRKETMKLIFVDKDTLWCGTQASLEAVLAVQDKLLAGGFDLEALAGNDGQEVDKPAPRYEVTDGVAVIPIRGPLINADIPDN